MGKHTGAPDKTGKGKCQRQSDQITRVHSYPPLLMVKAGRKLLCVGKSQAELKVLILVLNPDTVPAMLGCGLMLLNVAMV